jgi:hypothetical protein
VLIDGFDHLWSKNLYLEIRIMISESRTNHAGNQENQERDDGISQVFPENPRVSPQEKVDHRGRTRSVGRIDGIVGAREQLVKVSSKIDRTAVFAKYGKVGGDLAIEQAQFLQFGTGEGFKSFARAVIEQLFEPAPVRLALFQPASGDHNCSQPIS